MLILIVIRRKQAFRIEALCRSIHPPGAQNLDLAQPKPERGNEFIQDGATEYKGECEYAETIPSDSARWRFQTNSCTNVPERRRGVPGRRNPELSGMVSSGMMPILDHAVGELVAYVQVLPN